MHSATILPLPVDLIAEYKALPPNSRGKRVLADIAKRKTTARLRSEAIYRSGLIAAESTCQEFCESFAEETWAEFLFGGGC